MNPPMMLTCGHVLAKDSIAKLAKNGQYVPFSFARWPYIQYLSCSDV